MSCQEDTGLTYSQWCGLEAFCLQQLCCLFLPCAFWLRSAGKCVLYYSHRLFCIVGSFCLEQSQSPLFILLTGWKNIWPIEFRKAIITNETFLPFYLHLGLCISLICAQYQLVGIIIYMYYYVWTKDGTILKNVVTPFPKYHQLGEGGGVSPNIC